MEDVAATEHRRSMHAKLYTIPVISCKNGVINWTVNLVNVQDGRTRKLLTMHKVIHPGADIGILNITQRSGGWDLRNINHAIEGEAFGLLMVSGAVSMRTLC